jgi:amino acid transporter
MGFDGDWSRRRFGPPVGAIVATIVILIGWLVFIIIYALFWSGHFTFFQNIILTIASLLIMGLVIGLVWVLWWRMRGPMHRWKDDRDRAGNETKPPNQ